MTTPSLIVEILRRQFAEQDLLSERLRGLLGRFLFTADDVFKPIGVLSGGRSVRS